MSPKSSDARRLALGHSCRYEKPLVLHLGVARQVLVGHQIRSGRGDDGLFHPVAVAVIGQLHSAGLHQAVLKVIEVWPRAA